MKEAVHIYKTSRKVHFVELRPGGRRRFYNVSIPSLLRLGRWLAEHHERVIRKDKFLVGTTYIIERRER